MPKIARELSALQVGRIKDEGDHQVGGVPGLLLRIKGNSRIWVLRVRVGSRRQNIGLGSLDVVSLAQARELARQKRQAIDAGQHEGLTRLAAKRARVEAAGPRILFRDAARECINARRPEWKNAKHAEQWSNTLETYAHPIIGDLDVPAITVDHVMRILEPIWLTKTETASRVRGRVEAVIDYANVRYRLGIENPARWKGHLEVLLPARSKVAPVEHHEAVPWKAAPAAAKVIWARRGISAKALQALILSACRVNEVLGMRRGEVLVKERLWIVPADRMKWPRDHFVPLSRQLLELLQDIGLEGDPAGLVFASSQRNRAGLELSQDALRQVMIKNHVQGTPHGWRSTFKDWASEATEYPNELSEMALAHTIENKAEAAYRRGDLLERRRPMMQAWADYVTGVKKPARGGHVA